MCFSTSENSELVAFERPKRKHLNFLPGKDMTCLLSTTRCSWETYHLATRKVNNNKHWHSWAVSEGILTIVTERYLICRVLVLIKGGNWGGMRKIKENRITRFSQLSCRSFRSYSLQRYVIPWLISDVPKAHTFLILKRQAVQILGSYRPKDKTQHPGRPKSLS